jgi:hypothetical protein
MLPPIIHTEHNDSTYGTFWMECVGIVDYPHLMKSLEKDDFKNWYERYHPVKYFRNSGMLSLTLHDHVNKDGKSLYASREAIFVPTVRINKNWDFHGCQYGKAVGGHKRPMPLVIPVKTIKKWQDSLPNRVLTPLWMEQCSTIDQLQIIDEQANQPCAHCKRRLPIE